LDKQHVTATEFVPYRVVTDPGEPFRKTQHYD